MAIDNAAHQLAGNENDRGDVARFINALNHPADPATLMLGHRHGKTGPCSLLQLPRLAPAWLPEWLFGRLPGAAENC
ncbi:hypothetical protein [Croceicoccus sp. BE223]|uniref:hypothetical protein n=1 Tax=Croceicoccus sp. BE223 TaxID=2817716 RepID=UPI00285DE05B|nr:hypothetical protein [Croceicoccus sp. BE223]MDR7103865.1 hypothetical protein [Croceicoccus sp. BE223]